MERQSLSPRLATRVTPATPAILATRVIPATRATRAILATHVTPAILATRVIPAILATRVTPATRAKLTKYRRARLQYDLQVENQDGEKRHASPRFIFVYELTSYLVQRQSSRHFPRTTLAAAAGPARRIFRSLSSIQ